MEQHQKEVKFSLNLKEDLDRELTSLARQEERSKGAMVRIILQKYFKKRASQQPSLPL